MQPSSGMNALLLLGAAPAATNGGQATLLGEDASLEQSFSQLLSDFGAQADGQHAENFMQGQFLQPAPGTALTAQEIDLDLGDLMPESPAGGEAISPQEAAVMLEQFDALPTEGMSAADAQALAKLKEQLQQIAQSDAPKTLTAILEAVPAAKESRLSAALLTAAMIAKKQAGQSQTEEAPKQVLAMMQNMQATMFRSVLGETAPEAKIAEPSKKKGNDLTDIATVVVPLAYTTTVAVPVDSAATHAETAPIASAMPMDSDQLVPPLNKQASAEALPDVDLPSFGTSSAQASSAAGALSATRSGAALDGNASSVRDDTMIKDISALMGDAAGMPDGMVPLASHASTHSAAVSAKSVDVVPTHGFLNHAPVSEQVQVAIHQASKDGVDRITIQLDPVDLGRVEVQMQTNKEGQTQIHFTIDNPDTFDGLSRDARVLERSLQEAGIKADTGSMQFNLRQQPQPQMQSGMNDQRQPQQQAMAEAESKQSVTGVQASAALTRNYIVNVREGVDISA